MTTPRHGHAPIKMRKRPRWEDFEQPGDFCFEKHDGGTASLYLAIPDVDVGFVQIRIPVSPPPKIAGHWEWDGDRDKPTLRPSIHQLEGWHGWVRGGELVEA